MIFRTPGQLSARALIAVRKVRLAAAVFVPSPSCCARASADNPWVMLRQAKRLTSFAPREVVWDVYPISNDAVLFLRPKDDSKWTKFTLMRRDPRTGRDEPLPALDALRHDAVGYGNVRVSPDGKHLALMRANWLYRVPVDPHIHGTKPMPSFLQPVREGGHRINAAERQPKEFR